MEVNKGYALGRVVLVGRIVASINVQGVSHDFLSAGRTADDPVLQRKDGYESGGTWRVETWHPGLYCMTIAPKSYNNKTYRQPFPSRS